MKIIRESVDDRNMGICRKVNQILLGKGSDHDTGEITFQYACRVGNRFAASHLSAGLVEVDGMSAELENADFKRDSCPSGGFCKDHADAFSLERFRRAGFAASFLQFGGKTYDSFKIRPCDIHAGQ